MASEKITARQSVINRTGMTPEQLIAQFQVKQKQSYEFKKTYA